MTITKNTFLAGSDEWLSWRKKFITGTEVAVLFGLNPYKTVDSLRREKIEGMSDYQYNTFADIGHLLEPSIIAYCEGTPAVEEGKVSMLADEKLGISSSFDGLLYGCPLECKSIYCNSFNKKYKGRVPDHYILQLLLQMYLMKKEMGFFGVALYLPEDFVHKLENEGFNPVFNIFPLIIEDMKLFKIENPNKEIYDLVFEEVTRYLKDPYEFEVKYKKEMKKLLKNLKLEELT